jgi:hypothetical protein
MFAIAVSALTVLSQPLDSLLVAAHRADNAHARDQFAEMAIPNYAPGTPFEAEFSFSDARQEADNGTNAYYTYADGKLSLNLFVSDSTVRIGSRRTALPSYVGQNSFGAKARVSASRKSADALLLETQPSTESVVQEYGTFLDLPPAKAKDLLRFARVIISGTIGGTEGPKVGCEAQRYAATISDPTEFTVRTCWVRVRATRVAFVRKDTNQVLAQWVVNGH